MIAIAGDSRTSLVSPLNASPKTARRLPRSVQSAVLTFFTDRRRLLAINSHDLSKQPKIIVPLTGNCVKGLHVLRETFRETSSRHQAYVPNPITHTHSSILWTFWELLII